MSGPQFMPIAETAVADVSSVLTNRASADLATALTERRRIGPAGLSDLTREDVLSSTLSVKVAARLGIPFGSFEGSFSRRVFVQEYAKYVDIPEQDGKVRWGVSIRWVSNINMLDAKANITSLPAISASAEFGYVEASSRFQIIGMTSQRITELMPADVELSVESYTVMKEALQAIKAEIWADTTTIAPTILAVYGEIPDDSGDRYNDGLVASWALHRIAEGRSLAHAYAQDPIRAPGSQAVIKSVYADIAQTTEPEARPSNEAKGRAKAVLHGISVKG